MSGIVDPWEEIVRKAQAGELADPYDNPSIREGSYGPQTSGQMAAPDAPMYLPPAPPAAPDTKTAYSATDSQNEAFGKTVKSRDVNAEIAKLTELRAGIPGTPAQSGPGQHERDFANRFSAQDAKARQAFLANWMAGGPDQAYKFQQAYEQKRAQVAQGMDSARGQDVAEAERGAPITEAQAQMLVRTYGITPEAASRMTNGDYAKAEGVLKSTPYVANQALSGERTGDLKIMQLLADQRKNESNNAAGMGEAQLRGQQSLNTVRANKGHGGGGGGAGQAAPRDLEAALIGILGSERAEDIHALVPVLDAGDIDISGVPEHMKDIAANYSLLKGLPSKVYDTTAKGIVTQGGIARTNQGTGAKARVEANVAGQQQDVSEIFKAKQDFNATAFPLASAHQAASRLGPKLSFVVGMGPDAIGKVVQGVKLTPEDIADAGEIRKFVAAIAREQAGQSMTEGEARIISGYTGVQMGPKTDFSSILTNPSVLKRFINGYLKYMQVKKANIEQSYPGAFKPRQVQ